MQFLCAYFESGWPGMNKWAASANIYLYIHIHTYMYGMGRIRFEMVTAVCGLVEKEVLKVRQKWSACERNVIWLRWLWNFPELIEIYKLWVHFKHPSISSFFLNANLNVSKILALKMTCPRARVTSSRSRSQQTWVSWSTSNGVIWI